MSTPEKQLAELRELFIRNSMERLDNIGRAIDLLEHSPKDEETLRTLFRHLHSLAGLGGTYGFDRVSEISSQAESLCDGILSRAQPVRPEDITMLRRMARKIRQAFGADSLPDHVGPG